MVSEFLPVMQSRYNELLRVAPNVEVRITSYPLSFRSSLKILEVSKITDQIVLAGDFNQNVKFSYNDGAFVFKCCYSVQHKQETTDQRPRKQPL